MARLAPPRFLLFLLVFVVALPLAIAWHGWSHGPMLAFDAATLAFLASMPSLFRRDSAAQMRATAKATDANRAEMLAFAVIASGAVLVAVAAELQRPGRGDTALVLATLALAWAFANVVYALHYAHLYYMARDGVDTGGLSFPGTDTPDYGDFLYFAVTLGMTFQTSDVAIESRAMRRVATGQSVAAFVFNLGILAFTINILGGG
ncbi:hypothetical protein ASG29_03265 [Sphingomonas sp. Leaf412]|uniref:DUF1345 domain-containing protein n=1 Tax=Sphingomonas sp. Leaf412 TaxID=1736370 RepID=UPI0006FFFD31|nr:DUF1345 domain-containing protein [Sphingomonas sp. Leaf412]KQT35154.1 hypothetical protein ASG29_03265 [Sphingomonas sp. Leaf412]